MEIVRGHPILVMIIIHALLINVLVTENVNMCLIKQPVLQSDVLME